MEFVFRNDILPLMPEGMLRHSVKSGLVTGLQVSGLPLVVLDSIARLSDSEDALVRSIVKTMIHEERHLYIKDEALNRSLDAFLEESI